MLNVFLASDGHSGLFINQFGHLCPNASNIITDFFTVNEKIDPAVVTCGHFCCFGLSYRDVREMERTDLDKVTFKIIKHYIDGFSINRISFTI